MQLKLLALFSWICGLFLFFMTADAIAATPTVHVSPKPSWILPCKKYDKKPVARNIEDGAYLELIEEQVNVGKQANYNHFITQIISESGVQNNSEISVSFNPSYEQLCFHEIIVWRNNKPQNRLNADAFKLLAEENEFDKFIYNGTYSAKYIMSDIRKGDRIEYSYTVTGANPIFNNKFCRSIYLQGSELIGHQYTTLLFPANRTINIKPFNLLSQPKVSVSVGIKRYQWEDFQVPGVSTNKLQPQWVNKYARVQVSEYTNWAGVVNWGLKINPVQTIVTGELANTIAKLKEEAGNDKAKYFRAAVKLVQDEIRYMGIETGQYSHKANSPDKVFKQRYGDCKDKSLLLASILNSGGIPANLVFISTELQDKIENYIPSAALFNHVVVLAVINGKQVWVDATIADQGGENTNLYFPPYREGLILKAGNNGLTNIPETKAGKTICEENFKIIDEFLPVTLQVITTYTLNQADEIRYRLASTGIARTEKNYLDYYSKTYNKIEATDSIIIKDNRERNELTTIESYSIKNFFKRDSINGKYTSDFYADYISYQLPDMAAQIKTPVSVNYPYAIDCIVNITMPHGWDIANEHFELKRDAYKFTSDKTVSGDKLSLRYHFAFLKDYVPVEKVLEFKRDVKELKSDKLYYSFYYIPDIKKVPFQINKLMLIISALVMCVFAFLGLKIYKKNTADSNYLKRDSFPPALGGWLIVLVITLSASALEIIRVLFNEGYYSISKWNLVTTGTASVITRGLLIFKTSGYFALVCFSGFCLVLMFKRRDIAPRLIKRYYIFMVLFLFVDYFFNAIFKIELSDYDVEEIAKAIIVAAIWTYYLNVSSRVRETFTVPYLG